MHVFHQKEETNHQEAGGKEAACCSSTFQDCFHSNFSFIQLSMHSALETNDIANPPGCSDPKKMVQLGQEEKAESPNFHLPKEGQRHSEKDLRASFSSLCDKVCQCLSENGRCQDCMRVSPFHETAFSSSIDVSDAASVGSSMTSGYKCFATVSDHSWDLLMKKYEPILQECLKGNQHLIKINSLTRKFQRLQEKAIAEDDYEKADQLRRKLGELGKEKLLLNFQLPSQHPLINIFLDKFRAHIQTTLHESVYNCHRENNLILEKSDQKMLNLPDHDKIRMAVTKRDQLLEEKKWIQDEMEALKAKLAILDVKDQQLRAEILEQDHFIQEQDYGLSALFSWISLGELQTIGKALDEILDTSRAIPYKLDFPEPIKRLQEREQSLNMSIKDTAAKVCTSQMICSTLRKKVNHIDSHLPALLETKMLAASGGTFSVAKDLVEEIKSLTVERDRLERLLNEWATLNIQNVQELERVKEVYKRLKGEIQQEVSGFEKKLGENTLRYMDVLKEKLQSCGRRHHLLERIWEADLEACQLFIHGLLCHKHGPCVSEQDETQIEEMEDMADASFKYKWKQSKCLSVDSPKQKATHLPVFQSKHHTIHWELKEESQMLSTEVREKCERISEQLMYLDNQLQLAICCCDEDLTQSLQWEIQMVKETLQVMLAQLQPTKETREDAEVHFLGDSWCPGKQGLEE